MTSTSARWQSSGARGLPLKSTAEAFWKYRLNTYKRGSYDKRLFKSGKSASRFSFKELRLPRPRALVRRPALQKLWISASPNFELRLLGKTTAITRDNLLQQGFGLSEPISIMADHAQRSQEIRYEAVRGSPTAARSYRCAKRTRSADRKNWY